MHLHASGADTLRDAALAYADRGWYVLPLWWPRAAGGCACGLHGCESAGKHPVSHLVPNGLSGATPTLGTVREWWCLVPAANIGIRTGSESGLVVLDVDGQAGWRSLRNLVASHRPIRAGWACTGSGGWHGYLAHPGARVPNSAGLLGVGLDVRGDGGYVVAPPSLHAGGGRYRWLQPPAGTAPPPMPGWLRDLAAPPPFASGSVCMHGAGAASYAAAALRREAHVVAQAPPGQRNHALNLAAFKVGQLVGADLLEEATAAAALVAAGLRAGPGERKIRATVRRGMAAGMRRPRTLVSARR